MVVLPRARDPNRDIAFEIYKKHNGNIELTEIANQLNLSAGTIRGWKSKDNWEHQLNGTLQTKNTERSKRKTGRRGGQFNNKNAAGNEGGAPAGNQNAEKHGFFSKWLPEETAQIMGEIQKMNPLDILWDNIQLQFTAIIRAQRLMYVKDQADRSRDITMDAAESTAYQIQYAWDKHATFLTAQSRAMKTLESMIKQYDEMLHKNWDSASEEQKLRLEKLRVDIAKAKEDDTGSIEDDGFVEALKSEINEVWEDDED